MSLALKERLGKKNPCGYNHYEDPEEEKLIEQQRCPYIKPSSPTKGVCLATTRKKVALCIPYSAFEFAQHQFSDPLPLDQERKELGSFVTRQLYGKRFQIVGPRREIINQANTPGIEDVLTDEIIRIGRNLLQTAQNETASKTPVGESKTYLDVIQDMGIR